MSYGPQSVFSVTLATGATSTSALDLGRAWSNVYLETPTMTSGFDTYFQASNSLSGTFRNIYQRINSATVAAPKVTIGSATSQAIVDIPPGFRFMKFDISTAQTANSCTFKVYCSN